MEPPTVNYIEVITTSVFVPAAIAALVSYFTFKAQLKIEKLRLHDKDRTQAYKRLFVFARKIQNQIFPLAEDKKSVFIELMRKEYFEKKINEDAVYFPDEASKILDELESRYLCMIRRELIPEIDTNEEEDFIENKLFELAENLSKYVRDTMKIKGVRA